MRNYIKMENATYGYNNKPVLKVGDMEIGSGITCLLGPNGAGKTTFLRGITGVLEPITGRVLIEDIDIFCERAQDIRNKIGYLPENSFPYPDMNPREYLEYWGTFYGVSADSVNRVLKLMEIEEISEKGGNTLSQGQKRRVMIARIFLITPELLVLDEPTANLDPDVSYDLMHLIVHLGKKIPVIYSTHHLLEIENVFDRIVFVKDGKIMGMHPRDEIAGDIYEVYKNMMKSDGNESKLSLHSQNA